MKSIQNHFKCTSPHC